MDQDDLQFELVSQQLKQLYNIYIFPTSWNPGKSLILDKLTEFDELSSDYLMTCAYLNKEIYQKLIILFVAYLKQKPQSAIPSARLGDTPFDQMKKIQFEEKSNSTAHPTYHENIIVKEMLSNKMLNMIFNNNELYLKDVYSLIQNQYKSYIKQYLCDYIIKQIKASQQVYSLSELIEEVFQVDYCQMGNQQYYTKIIDTLFQQPFALSVIQQALEFFYENRNTVKDSILKQAIEQYTYGALQKIQIQKQTKLLQLLAHFLNYQTSYHQIFLDLIKNNIKQEVNTYDKLYYCIIYLIIHKCIPTNQGNYVIFLIFVSDIFGLSFDQDFKQHILELWEKQDEYETHKNGNEIFLLLQNFDNPLFIQNQLNQLNIEQLSNIKDLYNCDKVINIANIYLSSINQNAIDRPTIRQDFYELIKQAFDK